MKRILIVEHNIPKCLALSDMLGEFGFETGVADCSERALNMLSECDPLPNVILLNGNMPQMGSWKLREALRSNREYSKIPVLTLAEGSCTVTAELSNPEESFPVDSSAYRIIKALLT